MYTCGLSSIKITAFFFISFPGQPLIDPGEVNVSYYTGGSNTETESEEEWTQEKPVAGKTTISFMYKKK